MASTFRKITLRRTPCYGPCPVYELTILGTGEVTYLGEAHVAKAGAHSWRISGRRLERLAEAFERASYSRLEDRYTSREFTDAPGCLTSVEYEDGSSKRIVHYHGDPSAPDTLTELEDEIDRIVGVERYTEPELPPERDYTPTYLLTFNPEKAYKWEDLQDCIDDVRDHGFYATAWSCGRNRRITAGDRVFMMRQGHGSGERRGIFASGWATSDVYEQEHWDASEARRGKLALYVPIRLDVLLDSDSEPILSRSVLREDPLAGGPWDARTGGVAIPDEIAAELEKEWAHLLASKGLVQLYP
ncbi:MAG: DUF6438 domain-containing protein, partial [Actinobacteria bacterium]|nr:DUF6438 domain-containing protein [Actinomycetota bacterium]